MKKSYILTALLVVIANGVCLASDWPQYLGPDRNAVSTETGLMRSWPEEGPAVLWTVPLGQGFGGAVVSKGKVYVLDRVGNKQDVLRCTDLSTGTQDWTFAYDAAGEIDRPGSRSVPTIEGNNIYMCGSFGHLKCIDLRTHQAIW